MNPQEISKLFESRPVATIEQRLRAARQGQNAGYPTRFRIDPVIAVDGWKELYRSLIQKMKDLGLTPGVITLGTYRVIERSLPSLRMFGDTPPMDTKVLVPTGESKEQRRLRYPDAIRKEIYSYILGIIRDAFPGVPIGLCKETRWMRTALGYTDKDIACNCTVF